MLPELDAQTLSLITLMTYLGNILFTLMLYATRFHFRGSVLWINGEGLLIIAAALTYFRPILPPWLVIGPGNTLYLFGLVMFMHAIWVYRFRTPFPFPLYLAPLAVGVVLLILSQHHVNVRNAVFSFATASLVLGIYKLLKVNIEMPYRITGKVTGLPYLFMSVGLLLRGLVNLVEVYSGAPTPDPQTELWLMALGVSTAGINLFGYYMLAGSKMEKDIRRKANEVESQSKTILHAHRLQNQLMAVISHDLQGPIGGSVRYLNKHLRGADDLPEKYRDALSVVSSSLERTHQLLGNILLWTQTQNHTWVLEPETISLRPLVKGICELKAMESAAKDLDFDYEGVNGSVWADTKSVETIVRNLLSNAIKFSLHHRTIRLWTERSGAMVSLYVQDDGIGMTEDQVTRLFQIGAPVSTRGTDGETGTGMGLILCKEFAEINRGSLVVRSMPGQGTTVILNLPPSL